MSNYDKDISNLIHEVELERRKNAYEGYLLYRELKTIVDKRRQVKDEFIVVDHVARMDFRRIDRDSIDKVVSGLSKRKFTYRITEEVEGDDVL